MAGNQINGVMDSLLKGMDSVLAAKTVVGEPIQIGDTIILPLVDVSFGAGAGASSGGFGGKMTPSAVLVVKNGTTKLVNVKNQDTMTKILDMIPDIIEKFSSKKEDMMPDSTAVDLAFAKDIEETYE